MARTTDCLNTVIKNTSGGTRVFGFIPPHGVKLGNNETYSVPGDIIAAMSAGDSILARRRIAAFRKALENGDITIVSTPAVAFTTSYNDLGSVVLSVNNSTGAVGIARSCWNPAS